MKKSGLFTMGLVMLLLLALSVPGFGASWILNHKTNKLPSDLVAKINQAGGTLIGQIDEIGVAIAEFPDRSKAEKMASQGFDVMPDVVLNWIPETQVMDTAQHIGSNETFYPYQWFLPAIGAPQAWEAGQTGQGARVAILDTGIYYNHPDLYGNIDFAASTTFVPGTTDFLDDHGHGTHVAGIVAAADNNWGVIGVAPSATLIGIKVLAASGSGAISWIARGIIYAANQNVDIINMSLGGLLRKSGNEPDYTARDAAYMINLYRKAIHYATQKGALVIMSAGNDAIDMDHNWNYIHTPAEAGNGVIVSATGPEGFFYGATNFSRIASYTNFGSSTVSVAAPGGDFTFPGNNWWYDMIMSTAPSTTPGLYRFVWMAGTSMAAPVASGVAALIVGKHGHLSPAQLKSILLKSTDDLGKPGADPFYGKGFVNAFKAVQ